MAENQENENIEEKVEDKKEETEKVETETTTESEVLEKDINKELEEMTDRYKRLFAEFENYKKRNLKEKESLRNMLVSDIMMSILPIIDNLEKAISTGTKDTAYEEGIKMVLKQLKDTLTYHGVKEIETIGKPFDPELHEAVSHVTDEKGYIIGTKVIRHSMVIVAN